MQIRNNEYYSTPQFKQISLVKVSKKAFPNPAKALECADVFQKALEKFANQKPLGIVDRCLLMEGYSLDIKFLSLFESPGILENTGTLNKLGGESLDWLEKNTKQKVNKPASEDCHSFYVITDVDKYHYINNFGTNAQYDIGNKVVDEYIPSVKAGLIDLENPLFRYELSAKMAKLLDEKFFKFISGYSVKEFVIDKLEGLQNILKDLGINKDSKY